ncbi:MAG: chromosome segregation protein SMC [Chitinophagaceae bacterium]|nr:chromosome segregation protein SMC [Chitinophagaceae bacterium]
MRLKSLDIKGFKSFADKTHISLDNQITGIVGPNGCGKSNIVDAIRWVIGEHKIKTLRSDNLEDLVFNGSKTRNASGLAEVSLTFENTKNLLPTEFHTVTITRKFYKNGESEYRLNDVTCRLKDITNLFLDTGVTSDSYSIIELGMVDDIIKDKENSRRRMLEQAAGISIYKTRKKEAKLKLDATEQDLNRIEDLLFEISNNLRTLESQAKKAEKYHQIKNEYKDVSVEFVKASLEDFNSSYQTLNSQQQQEVDKILSLESLISREGAELEQQKLELTKKEEELHLLQKTFNELVDRLRKLENNKNLSTQRIEHLNQLITNIQHSIAESTQQTKNLLKATDESEKKLITEEDTFQKLKTNLEELRSHLDEKRSTYDQQKSTLDKLRTEHQQLQIKQFDTEKHIAIAENNINNQHRSIQQLEEENQNRLNEIEKLTAQRSSILELLDAKKINLENLKKIQAEATEKLLNSQAELESLRVKLIEENRTLDAKQNEYNLLKSLIDSLEGYPDSIKYLNKNASWNHNFQLLSEVFNVKDEYRTCVENYLDKYLNYYVVDTPEQAYQAIELLKDNKKGKAGFFILSEIQEKSITEEIPEGSISAFDVLQHEEKYKSLLKLLLHNVCITDDLKVVNPGNSVLLQKDGSGYKTGKRIVGGSVGLFEGNKIGRTQRLEKLSTDIQAIRQVADGLKLEIVDTQNKIVGYNQQVKDDQINRTKDEISGLENQSVQLAHKMENFAHQNEQAQSRILQLNEQLTMTQNGISDSQKVHAEMKAQMTLAFDSLQEHQQLFAQAEAAYNKTNEEYNQQNIIIARQQSRINEIKNERAIRENQIAELNRKQVQNDAQLADTHAQLETSGTELKALEEQLYQSLKEKEDGEKILNEKDQAFYIFRNQLAEKETELNKKRREKEHCETLLSSIKDKLTDMKLQLTSMKERLHVEFRIDLDEVLKQPRTGDQNLEELTAEVDKLKKRIDNLGEVNPMAVEAYKEMKARHDFIQEQKADLVNAKESLMKTIEEVEATANLKFKETFEKVRENFINVFHALFTQDDMCDMKLVDPENLAETTIEIYAQPKGKKPSTITQLSGGEKTLTSTAFLFAIYLIKPAPFCVLDEVDAPLDDANVGKFTNMIRKFSDNSQFIIVTHNKQTMASVDVIYGVTMQEAGVSKLVPVDFRSLN